VTEDQFRRGPSRDPPACVAPVPRDLTRACQAGHSQPLDRCPSDSDSRAAFTLGRWCRMAGFPAPVGLSAETDPLMGDLFRVALETGPPLLFQCWPHPSNPGQLLVMPVAGPLWRG